MLYFSNKAFNKLLIALTLYLTSLVAANTLGLKVMSFLFGAHLSVAVFSFPVVFLMTDVIGEVYGKKIARMFVGAGFVCTLLFILYSFISLAVPWSSNGLWVKDGYDQVFGISIRMAIASLLAFAIGEYQDVLAFFFFKKRFGSKHFWIRSNLSNVWSQFFDSAIFMLVAFLGVYPFPVLVSIIFTWWVYKVSMGFLYTPLSYVGMYLLKEQTHEHV